MDEECRHGMAVGTCSFCSPRKRVKATAEVVITASFDSRCSCGQRIYEGEKIGRVDDEWVCSLCFEAD